MHHHAWKPRAAVWLPAILLLFFPSAAESQIRIVEPAGRPISADSGGDRGTDRNAAVQLVVQEGHELERQSRWGDALSHYQDALRQFPRDPQLLQRYDTAKLHYDLGRRYGDESFRKGLIALRQHEALEQFSEVLTKIDAHYVDAGDWRRLIERGTRALDIALRDESFRGQHLPQVAEERIDAFRQTAWRTVSSTSIRSRHEAREAAASVADLAERQLGISPVATLFEYICACVGGLDTYSAYLTSGQLKDVYSQIDGNFVGLGIELKADQGALLIMNVISGSPADRSGLRAGDRIVEVDGHSTRDMTTDSAGGVLQGVEGSFAELTVESAEGRARTLRIRREHVEVPGIDRVQILDAERGVAYVRLATFQRTTNRDLDRALWQLHRDGMKSLIIDLRGNPGGLLSAAVEAADKFVGRGTIVSTRGRNAAEDFRYTAHAVATWHVPLVVLIDGESASASEIFAGAIRDHRRGTIVGERSYGKGSVQGIFPLASGGAGVRITTARFYTPAGTPIHEQGVSPDVTVHLAAKPSDRGRLTAIEDDLMLQAALQTAREQLAQR